MIPVKISHEDFKYTGTEEEKRMLQEIVDDRLQPIFEECIALRAFVNAILTPSGNFRIEPQCDDDEIQMIMQDLLPRLLPQP